MNKRNKAASTKHVKDLTEKEELEHYMSIMMEEFQSKLDLVVEGMEALRSEMRSNIVSVRSEIASVRSDMNNQFSFLNAAIRCNADGIRVLNSKMDHVIARVDDHEERIGTLERLS